MDSIEAVTVIGDIAAIAAAASIAVAYCCSFYSSVVAAITFSAIVTTVEINVITNTCIGNRRCCTDDFLLIFLSCFSGVSSSSTCATQIILL